jgi:uncharacterized membrane protein
MSGLIEDPHVQAATSWSKHRIEALTDGIYAVAMTLLVIDLKLPEAHSLATREQLDDALIALAPKALAWFISFFVLAIFWLSQHRAFHRLKVVDNRYVWLNIVQLAFVSLLPFSASLMGEHGSTGEAHCFYNGNMIALALLSLVQLLYVHRHPELHVRPISLSIHRAALVRIVGLVVVAAGAMVLALLLTTPIFATYLYLLMWPIGTLSRRIIARGEFTPNETTAPHP